MAKKIKQSIIHSSLLPLPQVINLKDSMGMSNFGANKKHPRMTDAKGKTKGRRKV